MPGGLLRRIYRTNDGGAALPAFAADSSCTRSLVLPRRRVHAVRLWSLGGQRNSQWALAWPAIADVRQLRSAGLVRIKIRSFQNRARYYDLYAVRLVGRDAGLPGMAARRSVGSAIDIGNPAGVGAAGVRR